ncbi:hypothetical protein BCEN4_740140 [Burkholderia cenocepacia]|nr:hypothetical protein BCEN4_740140 [Burkholderia cenocepacia]
MEQKLGYEIMDKHSNHYHSKHRS